MSVKLENHVSNFIKALIAISPSRNRLTQFLYIIYKNGSLEYDVAYVSFPEIMKNDEIRSKIFDIFGIEVSGDQIRLKGGGYGYSLMSFIDRVITLFEDPSFRNTVMSLIEIPEGIPNLKEEWVRVRVEGLKKTELGKYGFKVLRTLNKLGSLSVDALKKQCKIEEYYLRQTLRLLSIYKLVSRDYSGNYSLSEDVKKYSHLIESE